MNEHELTTEARLAAVSVAPATAGEAAFVEEPILVDVVREPTLALVRGRKGALRKRSWLVLRALAIADAVALVAALAVSQLVVGAGDRPLAAEIRLELLLLLLGAPVWVLAAKLYGLYGRDAERWDHSTLDDIAPVLHLVTIGTWIFYVSTRLLGLAHPDPAELVLWWALAIAFVTLARAIARVFCRRSVMYVQNAVIVGAGDVGQSVARKLLQHPEYGVNVVGFVDDAPKERDDKLGWLTVLGGPDRLPQVVRQYDVDRVIVAFSNDSNESTLELIRSVRDLDVRIDVVPRFFDVLGPTVTMHGVGGLPLVGLPALRMSRFHRALKRTVDVAFSALALIALAPFFALTALLIKWSSPGPVFFRQVRMGSGERTFRIFKFRTMTADADERKGEVAHLNKYLRNGDDPRMFKVVDDPRVTRVGRFLRRYSLDELPQLFNVLRGEMTLVGPRPLILEEDQHISDWGRRRLDLKPGMTGPWQVLGRNDIPFAEMVKLDYLYVTDWSLSRDVKLIFQTFPVIVRSRSIVY